MDRGKQEEKKTFCLVSSSVFTNIILLTNGSGEITIFNRTYGTRGRIGGPRVGVGGGTDND